MRPSNALSRRMFMVMPLALAACYGRRQVIDFAGVSMGTTYNVVVVDHTNLLDKAEVQAQVTAALTAVNKSMSNWDDLSEISRLNAAPAGMITQMSPDLAEVVQAAADINRDSDGRFDTTIGPLIELWGFGASGGDNATPSDAAVTAAMAKSGHTNTMVLHSGAVEKTRDDAQIYLAGIGKGFGADKVGRALEAMGIQDYLIEIGGDLYAAGRNPEGNAWQIGIESPNAGDPNLMGVVGVSGMGLASSGDYRNFFEVHGQKFSHLIDPATGRPVEHDTAAATVLAENAMLADAWSTAMLILGREKGLEIAEAHGLAVQFTDRDVQNGESALISFQSSAFKALTA